GCYRRWAQNAVEDTMPVKKLEGRAVLAQYVVSYNVLILGSAAGELTTHDLSFALPYRLPKFSHPLTQYKMIPASLLSKAEFVTPPFVAKAMNAAFRTQRGREFLQRLAFGQVNHHDQTAEAFLISVLAVVRQASMPEGIPDDVEPLIWESMRTI